MDKTYLYIYEKLYQHLYKFSISGNIDSKNAIMNLKKKVSGTKDKNLEHIYEMIVRAVRLERDEFEQKSRESEITVILWDDDDKLYLFSTLCKIYQYIFPDNDKVKMCESQIRQISNELNKKGEHTCLLEFEDADYMVQMHIDKKTTVYQEYDQEYRKRDFKLQNRSFMTILKGYSSSTPFFYPALRERFHNIPIKGGCIYIKWHGTGLVIDPGINFMENMHMSGLGINDIDAVIVTHNHIDHNGDLTTIDDLAFQFNKCGISLYMDKQTEQEFDRRLKKINDRHGLDLMLCTDFIIGSRKDIYVRVIPTQHILEGDNQYLLNVTYAVKVTLMEDGNKKAVIGFTSDTIYLDELSDSFQDCDYIIANMSETDENDYRKKMQKENHLGYSGCLKLIQKCSEKAMLGSLEACIDGKPRFIISEFWAGKGDVRRELIRRLRKESGYDYIYPGDIGMTFFLDQPTFRCGLCGGEQGLEQLRVMRIGLEYSPFYNVCDECILM
jgi:phosphoribosyl 1,2-cyclic phosphodiesterase